MNKPIYTCGGYDKDGRMLSQAKGATAASAKARFKKKHGTKIEMICKPVAHYDGVLPGRVF